MKHFNPYWYAKKAFYYSHQLTKSEEFTVCQTYEALKKCWKGYRIAFNQADTDNMIKYATRIQALQWELGLPRAAFPNLGLTRLKI